jgi:hypothetical protein
MTATRNGLSSRAATITVLAAVVWIVGAALLWRTTVPGDLSLPELDPRDYFSAADLTRTARYERFVRIDLILSLVASIAALLVLVPCPAARPQHGSRADRRRADRRHGDPDRSLGG